MPRAPPPKAARLPIIPRDRPHMLSSFRNLSKSWVGTIILALFGIAIVASFALADISNISSGGLGASERDAGRGRQPGIDRSRGQQDARARAGAGAPAEPRRRLRQSRGRIRSNDRGADSETCAAGVRRRQRHGHLAPAGRCRDCAHTQYTRARRQVQRPGLCGLPPAAADDRSRAAPIADRASCCSG